MEVVGYFEVTEAAKKDHLPSILLILSKIYLGW